MELQVVPSLAELVGPIDIHTHTHMVGIVSKFSSVTLSLVPILMQFTDEDESVRLCAHQAVEMCSRQRLGEF